MMTSHADNLNRQSRHRLPVAKDHRITRMDIFRPMLLNHAQNIASKKDGVAVRDEIPLFAVEIVDPIGKSEAEAGRTVAFAMSVANISNGLGDASKRVLLVVGGTHKERWDRPIMHK